MNFIINFTIYEGFVNKCSRFIHFLFMLTLELRRGNRASVSCRFSSDLLYAIFCTASKFLEEYQKNRKETFGRFRNALNTHDTHTPCETDPGPPAVAPETFWFSPLAAIYHPFPVFRTFLYTPSAHRHLPIG